jgi:hypothetical protein
MDWREFSVAIVGHLLSWPSLIFVIVLILRKPITSLLGRISSYEGLGHKLTFGDVLAKTEEEVEGIKVVMRSSEHGIPRATAEDKKEPLPADSLRAYGGSGAVIQAWNMVEDAVNQLTGLPYITSLLLGHSSGDVNVIFGKPARLAEILMKENVLPKALGPVLNDLRKLRNEVAHGAHSPTDGEALTYVHTATDVVGVLNSIADLIDRKYPDPEGEH